jgi:uncharacterized protein YndB with AHSA1/START domain
MTKAAGATIEVEILVDKDPGEMWDLITDVGRIGEWSPECVGATWLDGGTAQPGSRFEGRNDFGGAFRATVTCVVTEANRPAVFEWIVLDPSEAVERPGSTWRYELAAGSSPGQTRLLHRFVHGPGRTGLSRAMQESPEQAESILRDRLAELRKHMTITLEGMAAS